MHSLRRFLALVGAIGTMLAGLAGSVGTAHAAADITVGSFDLSSGVSRVTGTVSFSSSTNFTLTNVTLYDTSCDNRSARWRAQDLNFNGQEVDFPFHYDDQGCGTSVHWTSLSGSDTSARINFLQIRTQACNSFGCSTAVNSRAFYDPYS